MPGPEPGRPAVYVDGVSKAFEIPLERVHTIKERALHPLRRSRTQTLRALQDVTVDVRKGEFFGIVGRNGSGKSTLLKCLAGIYATDRGDIYLDGRLSAFIELGVGFNPDLPARENVELNATMLGLSPREARRRFDAVIDFAELREFTDLKIKNYSSGMLVRLAFAVMVQVDADILLIDEVLAVGDAAFQQKCFDEFERVRREGKTVLLVTHDMSAVRRFCDRGMLLEHGRQVLVGDPESVGNRYLELNFLPESRGESSLAKTLVSDGDAISDGSATIERAWLENGDGAQTGHIHNHAPCSMVFDVRFHQRVEHPVFSLGLRNQQRNVLLNASTVWGQPRTGAFEAGELARVRISLHNVLEPDRYYGTPSVERSGGGLMARHERLLSFVVMGTQSTGALVQLPHELVIERSPVVEPEPAGT